MPKIAFSAPPAGTIASATTEWPSAEAVNARLIQCATINCPLSLGVLQQRNLIIERLEKDTENVLVSATYAIPASGDKDRTLTFDVDVAILPGAAVRARFDDCAAGETQWIIINYNEQRIS